MNPDPLPPRGPISAEAWLFARPFDFNFFQAVRLLQKLDPSRQPVGRDGPPLLEAVRFRAHPSLSFPPSMIYDLSRPARSLDYEGDDALDPDEPEPPPALTVAFMGLTGPKGVLPVHYTERLIRLAHDQDGPEKYALRAWFDLFNHRLISLFFRAWEKYRLFVAYEQDVATRPARGEAAADPNPFLRGLFSLIGLGDSSLRGRLRVTAAPPRAGAPARPLAEVDDLALISYGGFLAQRRRCAASLEALLADYFQTSARVQQFRGQWLILDRASQSTLAPRGGNNRLGKDTVAGRRVWEARGKFRVRLGPLCYERFNEFLPDRTPAPARKAFFLLCHLVRLYVGPEFRFDVQLVLAAADVPKCRLSRGDGGPPPRLGWNTWLRTRPRTHDAEDVVFEDQEVVRLGRRSGAAV